jgi:O-antigen ligase
MTTGAPPRPPRGPVDPGSTGPYTVAIVLPVLPFSEPGRERRRIEIGGGAVAVAGGALVLLALVAGTRTAALVVGGLLAVALVLAAALVPAVALVLLVVTEFANVSGVLIDNGLPGIATPLLGLGALSVLLATRSPQYRARFIGPPIAPAVLLAVYIVSVLPAAMVTVAPVLTGEKVSELVRDGVFLVVVLLLAQLSGRPWAIAAALVAPLVVISALSVVNQLFLQDPTAFFSFARISKASGELVTTPRYSGPMEDSNFWGRVLVLGLPFALALAQRAGAARRRLPAAFWAVSVLILLAGTYLTQSRGTLISAFVAAAIWVVAAGPRVRRQSLLLIPVIALVLLLPGIGDRIVNVSTAFDDQPAYAKDPSLVERAAAGEIAREIFAEHLILGTGPATFASEVDTYAARKPDRLIGVTTATHNLYLEIGSETGVVGLFGWAVLMGGVVLLAVRSLLRLAGVPPDGADGAPTRALAAAALAAVLGWSLASLFLHLALVRTLWIVLALIGLLHVMTRERRTTAAEQLASTVAARGLRTGLSVAATMAVAGGLVGGTILYNLSQQTYTGVARVTLTPAAGTFESYGLDIRSRRPVLPAYAAMIQGDQSRKVLKVDAEPATGLITFTGLGSTLDEAQRRVDAALAGAPRSLQRYGADKEYNLVTVTPPEVTVERMYPPLAIVLAGAAVMAELIFCLLVLRLMRQRTR